MPLYHDQSTEKLKNSISPKLGSNRKTCNQFLTFRHIIILNFFENYKCSGIASFLQSSRYISIEQPCLKTSGLYNYPLLLSSSFHFFYFIVSAPISFILCSPILHLFIYFFIFLLKSLSGVV